MTGVGACARSVKANAYLLVTTPTLKRLELQTIRKFEVLMLMYAFVVTFVLMDTWYLCEQKICIRRYANENHKMQFRYVGLMRVASHRTNSLE